MLKKAFPIYFLFCLLATAFAPAPLQAGEYVYDGAESRVSFALIHLGIITARGRFQDFSGSFRFNSKEVGNSYVDIRIKTASVESDSAKRDENLCSDKFFWSEKYPEIRFTSRQFKETGGMNFDIEGELTIRGITRPVVFRTRFLSEPVEAEAGRPLRFHAETDIRRKDFELGTKGDPVVFITNEILKITLEVEGRPLRSGQGA